jgi:hypothetical protein
VRLCSDFTKISQTDYQKIAALVKEYESLTTSSDAEETTTRKKAVQPENLHNVGHDERQGRQMERSDTGSRSTTSTSIGRRDDNISKAEQRAYRKAIKHEKSLKKSAKNSERHTIALCQSDIDAVTKALHGDLTDTRNGTGHPLATDHNLEDVIERNLHFVANIQEHKVYLRRSVRTARRTTNGQKKSRKNGRLSNADESSADHESEELVRGVLLELGIDLSATENERPDSRDSFSTTPPAKIAAVVRKLRTAILEDLEKHENEQKQTCIRAGGFWRYVGKPVFDRMTEVARCIDWRTGSIIKDGAEDEEVEMEVENVDANEDEGENEGQEE